MSNPLAYVRDTCGKIIHLGMFESVSGLRADQDTITLGINRAQSKPRRGMSWHVSKRGTTLYTFKRTDSGWILVDTFTVWWSTDETHAPALNNPESY